MSMTDVFSKTFMLVSESVTYEISTVDNMWIKQQLSGMFLARINPPALRMAPVW